MQLKPLLVVACATLAVAQEFSSLLTQLPACSISCLAMGANAVGCNPSDFDCQFIKQKQLQTTVLNCLKISCSDDHSKAAQGISKQIYKAVKRRGVSTDTTTVPPPTTTTPPPGAATGEPAAAGSSFATAASSIQPAETVTPAAAPAVTAGASGGNVPAPWLGAFAALGAAVLL